MSARLVGYHVVADDGIFCDYSKRGGGRRPSWGKQLRE